MPAIKLSYPEPQATDRRLRRRVLLIRNSLSVRRRGHGVAYPYQRKSRAAWTTYSSAGVQRSCVCSLQLLGLQAPAPGSFFYIDATPVTHVVDHLGCAISRVSRRCSKRDRRCRGNLLRIYFNRVVYAFWEHALPIPKKTPLTPSENGFRPEN